MITTTVTFGARANLDKVEAEEVTMLYLWRMVQAGQIVKEYFLTWIEEQLVAHVGLTGPGSFALRYHSKYGKTELRTVKALFGQTPCWSVIDDEIPQRLPTWKGAPLLYLFTSALAKDCFVCRGDGKPPIPVYLLPLPDDVKEALGRWERDYVTHDELWLSSGALEVSAYKQMAEPSSKLSEFGRDLCRQLELMTGVPTYYYLTRYWGRNIGEAKRLCPGCNRDWHRPHALGAPRRRFHEFDFRCEPCRLVSHLGVATDGAHRSRIGEFKPSRKSNV